METATNRIVVKPDKGYSKLYRRCFIIRHLL